jgi:hypothetical protein
MPNPRTNADPRVAVIACTADDMVLDRCEGCGRAFPDVPGKPFASLDARDRHARTCIAYRDYVIATKLAAQARDDGRDDDAEELMEGYL